MPGTVRSYRAAFAALSDPAATLANVMHCLGCGLGRVAGCLATLCLLITGPRPSAAVQFAAFGDLPYDVTVSDDGRTDTSVYLESIVPMLRDRDDVAFVIHYGDTGRPKSACSDDWLRAQRRLWSEGIRKPVLYTPGDNDWTDCDRKNVPNRVSEVERLEAVRRIMFSTPPPVDASWRAARQDHQPENATWWVDSVRFVSVHVVGTSNGRAQILIDCCERTLALVDQRDAANRVWLERAFASATDGDTHALVIVTHVDPFGPDDLESTPYERCIAKPAYAALCEQIARGAANLGKPVLLVHGDSNAYCLDQPFPDWSGGQIWRLNGPGDFKYIDAALVRTAPDSATPAFTAFGLLSGEPVPSECDYRR